MDVLATDLATIERLQPTEQLEPAQQPAGLDDGLRRRRITRRRVHDAALRCVSSGYLSDECSCRATIPAGVVSAAWADERHSGATGDRFFHFAWEGEVWLGYASHDGHVRGVYCPRHSAERDRRYGLAVAA